MSDFAALPAGDNRSVSVRQGLTDLEISHVNETAMTAVAAQQRAIIESRFVVAMRRPRNWADVRQSVNQLCADPGFAAEALYVKPIARTPEEWKDWSKRERLQKAPDDWPRGFSIRFIEAVLFASGNFSQDTLVIYEDDDKRMVVVGVTDLERNSSYTRTIATKKTVERRTLKKNQEYVATRQNSQGELLYIIEATDEEVTQKEAAAVSKAIRTLGEKLLPPHYKAEWRQRIESTIMDAAAKDPQAEQKKILDNFAALGVKPSMLEQFLEHPIETSTPAEYVKLRGIYTAMLAGEATWNDVMGGAPDEGEEATPAQKALQERIKAQQKRATAPNTPGGQGQQPQSQPSGAGESGQQKPTGTTEPKEAQDAAKGEDARQPTEGEKLAAEPPAASAGGPVGDIPKFSNWDAFDRAGSPVHPAIWIEEEKAMLYWHEKAGNYRRTKPATAEPEKEAPTAQSEPSKERERQEAPKTPAPTPISGRKGRQRNADALDFGGKE